MISGPWIESKFAPASFATAFAISVFPVPGGPNRRTPFGGSIPRRSNSSACFSGSSIISRTLRSSSLSPPMSSYVTVGVRTSPSRTGSSFISMIVSSTIWTTPFGITLITMNGRAPPIRAIPGTITTSPFVRGRFRRPRFTKFSIPWPKLILWPSEMIGAIVTRSAAKTSAFLTSTLSPMETPTFRRTRPSIRMIPFPSSSCITRNSFAAVDFLPMISMSSPTSTPRAIRVFVSTRARPGPTSDCGASATLRTTLSGTEIPSRTTLIKDSTRLSIGGRAFRRHRRRGRTRRGWRGRGSRRRRCAAPGTPRLSVNRSSSQRPPLLDLGRLVDGQVAGLDDLDPTVRSDHDLLADDEVRGRALQVHLVGRDAVRAELASPSEESAGPPHRHLRAVNHRRGHVPAELDHELAGLQGPAETRTAIEMEFLGGRPPSDVEAPPHVDLLGLDVPAHVESAGAVDLRSTQVTVHLRRARGMEIPSGHVPLEDAGPRRLHEVRLQVAGDAAGSRGLELVRAYGVPGDDAGARDLDVPVPGLDALSEVREAHPGHGGLDGLADPPLEVRHVPQHRFNGCSNRPLDQQAEVLRMSRMPGVLVTDLPGLLAFGLLGLRLVPGLDLDVRLLGDLASREPLLETPEDFGSPHRRTTLRGARISASR